MKLIQMLKRLAVPAVLFLALAVPSQAKPGKGKGHAYGTRHAPGLRKQDNWKKSSSNTTRYRRDRDRDDDGERRTRTERRRTTRYRSTMVDGERRYYRIIDGRRVYYTRTSTWDDGVRKYIYTRLR